MSDRTEETRSISIASLMARRATHVQDEPDYPMSDVEAVDDDGNETFTDSEDDEDDDGNSISGDESIPILIDDM